MAKDIFHEQCKEALQDALWNITHDPYTFEFLGQPLFIDLGAEQLLGAEKEGKKIAVEVKSFIKKSDIHSFHEALGQYINYKNALSEIEPDRVLYLAVPQDAYSRFFETPFVQHIINKENVFIVVFDPIDKKIMLWIH